MSLRRRITAASRIAVVGCCGSGKTHLSRSLATRLSLPLIHLDDIYWHPNWRRTSIQDWTEIVHHLAHAPSWIIDGNYLPTMECRLRRADLAIFLDLSTWQCVRRVFVREIRRAAGQLESLPARVREGGGGRRAGRDYLSFWLKVLLFRRRIRPKMIDLFEAYRTPTIRLRSRGEIDEFLERL